MNMVWLDDECETEVIKRESDIMGDEKTSWGMKQRWKLMTYDVEGEEKTLTLRHRKLTMLTGSVQF